MRELYGIAVMACVLCFYLVCVIFIGRTDAAAITHLLSLYSRGAVVMLVVVTILLSLIGFFSVAGSRQPVLDLAGRLMTRWRSDRFMGMIWPAVMFCVLLATFNAFKQTALPRAGFGLDPTLVKIDRGLFLGWDAWRVTHALMPWPEASWFIDRLYHSWFVPMSAGVFVCAVTTRKRHLRATFLLTYMLIWIVIGSLFAYLFGSAGPCFYNDYVGDMQSFSDLQSRLHAQSSAVGGLVSLNSQTMLRNVFASGVTAVGGGISAMPSVHVGLAVLFALGLWSVSRWLGAIAVAYAVVIWIGSIHLGWHYALDGIVAAPLTLLLWRISSRVMAAALNDPDSEAVSAN